MTGRCHSVGASVCFKLNKPRTRMMPLPTSALRCAGKIPGQNSQESPELSMGRCCFPLLNLTFYALTHNTPTSSSLGEVRCAQRPLRSNQCRHMARS